MTRERDARVCARCSRFAVVAPPRGVVAIRPDAQVFV
jgi:hypothetical protein